MKCKKCSERAAIKMPQHNMALCREHFLEWIPQYTQRTIEKYDMFTREEKILVAVSGGKDSLALWDVPLPPGLSGRWHLHQPRHHRPAQRMALLCQIQNFLPTIC